MVTSSIQTRRRLGGSSRQHQVRRRRSRWQIEGMAAVAGSAAAARSRLSATGRIYLAAAVLMAALIAYLLQSAQVTKDSYDIQQLQAQRADLLAQQGQLKYQEASLQAPAQISQAAAQAGLVRALPAGYASYRQVAIDLGGPATGRPADQVPAWQRGLMAEAAPSGASSGR